MRLVYWLVGVAATLFVVGGVGVIAAFAEQWEPAVRQVFMYIFLGGLMPTAALLVLGCGIGLYHTWVTRVQGRYPVGWFTRSEGGEHAP